jgi:glycosyltransferase involved in cell wall biosynthesis
MTTTDRIAGRTQAAATPSLLSIVRRLIRRTPRLARGKFRLLLVDTYSGVGGGQKQLIDFALASEAMGKASVMAVVDSSNSRFRSLLDKAGVHYKCLDFDVDRHHGKAKVSFGNACRIVRQAIAVGRVVSEYEADVVQFYNYQSGAICVILALLRTKAILTLLHLSGRSQTPAGTFDYVKFFFADAVCYNSYATKSSYSKVATRFQLPENILYSVVKPPSAKNANDVSPDERAIFCAQPTRKYVGYFGSIFPWKNVEHVIKAVALLNQSATLGEEYFALIVGAGAEENESQYQADVKALAKAVLPLQSSILSEQDNIFATMRRCDVLVLPSQDEPYGRVLIEAMYLKVPFVATNSGGPKEIKQASGDRVGVLVPANDIEALAAAIRDHAKADRGSHPGVPWALSVEGIIESHYQFFYDQFGEVRLNASN